jgi:rubrerythrin
MEDVFDAAMLVIGPTRCNEISPIERLLNEFEAHEATEEITVKQYRDTLETIKNPATRLLLQMVVSDEERHRTLIHAMAATLKGSLMWTKPEGSLERDGSDRGGTTRKLLVMTDEFIKLEKEGIRQYQDLVKESAGYYHGLFKILLDSMIRDSEKHIELLEFLRERLKVS